MFITYLNTFGLTVGTIHMLKHLAAAILFAFYNNNCKNTDCIIKTELSEACQKGVIRYENNP